MLLARRIRRVRPLALAFALVAGVAFFYPLSSNAAAESNHSICENGVIAARPASPTASSDEAPREHSGPCGKLGGGGRRLYRRDRLGAL